MLACILGKVMVDTLCWVNLKSPLCPTEIEFSVRKDQQQRGTH